MDSHKSFIGKATEINAKCDYLKGVSGFRGITFIVTARSSNHPIKMENNWRQHMTPQEKGCGKKKTSTLAAF